MFLRVNSIKYHSIWTIYVEQKIPGNVNASEILMSRTKATIVEPYSNVSEGVIHQKSFHLKHISAVKIPGNFSASEILMSRT